MRKSLFLLASIGVLLAGSIFGGELNVGSEVPEFQVKSLDGDNVAFSEMSGDVTVVTFISTECPVSNAYNERMKAIYGDYAPQGVRFVFLNSNKAESSASVREHKATNGFEFEVYKDDGNIVADLFGASVTPESFVTKGGRIVYHGRIDDARTGNVTENSLRDALDAVLAGKTVDKAETKAFGCSIKRVNAS